MNDPELTRRTVLTTGGGAAAGLALGGQFVPRAVAADQPSSGAATISGTVFEDRSAAGRRQAGDPGLADVLVSNGRDVVRTDADGPLQVCPSTTRRPSSSSSRRATASRTIPTISRSSPTSTSPAARRPVCRCVFRGIEPTGPLPAALDFPLRKTPEPQAFEVILFTDPQPESQIELDYVRDAVIGGVVGTKAAFGMTTGDLMFDDLSLYDRYNRMIGQIGVPWYHIGGNHDINYESLDGRYARETFKRHYGATYYAFEYGQVLFVMLDNVDYLGTDPSHPAGAGRYEGRIGDKQRAFVANLLAQTADSSARRHRHAYSFAQLSRSQRCFRQHDRPHRAFQAPRRPQGAEPVRPHAHDRTSLFRPGGRRHRCEPASSPRDDGRIGFVVERASGQAWHRRRGQSRRQVRTAIMCCRSTATAPRHAS